MAGDLAEQLRNLRLTGLPSGRLTQTDIARAFGVSTPLISSWEKSVRPSGAYLDKYARLFATPRSFTADPPTLFELAQLTDGERARYDEIKKDFGLSEPANPLYYPDGRPITIVCAELPEKMQPAKELADPLDPDHVELYNYADLDALVELYAYVGRINPDSHVRRRLVTRLTDEDLENHLLVLGGVDFNTLTRQLLDELGLPVVQVERDGVAGGFEVTDAGGEQRTLVPDLREENERTILREDVAHLCRAPNPFSPTDTTVTLFNGMFGRGTYGIVRALTDTNTKRRAANFRYLERRFAGAPKFSLVCRIPVVAGVVKVPDLTDASMRLHEWPFAPA
ncbi:helix-turn-helix transcriptional regulator [Dactylosporangium sp. NPDC049140]|jgi:transcriptional regulator with XRE-family HTH domain|uniref:helix-turn-helix transcriptional regulator n=1 Tax=Dactylosporangium sp. NPDC049140 TaxID=3155647 RepID=UPI0033C9C1D4